MFVKSIQMLSSVDEQAKSQLVWMILRCF